MAVLFGVDGVRMNVLRLVVIVALVVTSLPSFGVGRALADDPPIIHVSISGDWIEFFNFTVGEVIDVVVDGELVDAVVVVEEEEPGRFSAEFAFDFVAGQTVVASQGTVGAEVLLVDMNIGIDEFEVFGSGPVGTTLFVEAGGAECGFEEHQEVTPDVFGDWVARADEGGCPSGFGEDASGSVFHFDTEGDGTIVETENYDLDRVVADLTLTEDHEGGFEIVRNDVTLDCDGHRIHSESGEIGVHARAVMGVTVKNCVIEGFWASLLFEHSFNNTIVDNVSMYPEEWGFAFDTSESNTVEGNQAVSENSHGFVLLFSDSNTFTGNEGSSNGGHGGVLVLDSSGNIFSDNEMDGYQFGFTLESAPIEEDVFEGSADNNHFVGNRVTNSELVGFFLTQADGNVFTENFVGRNLIGIGLGQGGPARTPEAVNNSFLENTIRHNETGYANWFETTGNVVKENFFCNNVEHIDGGTTPPDEATRFEENKYCGPEK